MKKTLLSLLVLAVLLCFSTADSHAVTLSFDPVDQDVDLGNQAMVDLVVSGLGDYAPDSLSTFDLDITFNPTVLAFNDASFGDQLDLFGFGSYSMITPGIDSVNLYELSFDFPGDLDALQAGSFTLASLSFDTIAAGSSPLGIDIYALGDTWGNPLTARTIDGTVNVTGNDQAPIPEPATIVLLGSGLAGMGFFRRKRK